MKRREIFIDAGRWIKALARLWDAIFAASRADVADPLAAWKTHDASLHARAGRMNEKRYAALYRRSHTHPVLLHEELAEISFLIRIEQTIKQRPALPAVPILAEGPISKIGRLRPQK